MRYPAGALDFELTAVFDLEEGARELAIGGLGDHGAIVDENSTPSGFEPRRC